MSGDRIASRGRWSCLAGASLGAISLVGWITRTVFLTQILPSEPRMMPNTSVALLFVGVAGALRHREDTRRVPTLISSLLALVVLAMGVGTLAEYLFGANFGIDQLGIHSESGLHIGRMSPTTALALTLLASALLVFDVGPTARARPPEWLVLSAGLTAMVGLTGMLLGAPTLYRWTHEPVIGLALPTGVSLLLISLGLLLERPNAGFMRVITSAGPGGVLLRALLLPTVLAPILLGLVVTRVLVGIEGIPLAVATLVIATAMVGVLSLSVIARPLNQKHEALERARAQTHELVEQASDGVFVADLDGRYTDANSAGCRMLGYTRNEIVGKSIIDLIPAHDIERLTQSKERMLEGRIAIDEWTLRRKDGTYLPVEVSAKIHPDGRWQGFVRDISERKTLERNLRLAEMKASGIVSISADAIISIDENQRITQFNEGAEKIFGYSRDEAIGAPLEMLIPDRFLAIHRRHVEKFVAGVVTARRMGERIESIVGLRKNGQEFPVDATISKLEVGGTKVLTVALRDITDRKRIEVEERFLANVITVLAETLDYEETVQNLAKAFASSPGEICIVETVEEGGQVRRIAVAHGDESKAALVRNLQRVPLDLRRPHLGSVVLDTKQPLLMSGVTSEYIDSVTQSEDHGRVLSDLGATSLMALPLLAHGRLFGSIVLVRTAGARPYTKEDLSFAERVIVRAALAIENARLYDTAQRAIRARDEVLEVVAHDLRNPLSAILLQTSRLARGGEERDRPSRGPVEGIRRAATRMNRLIEDLLDVMRMEAGRLSIETARVSTSRALFESMEAHEPLVGSASLELRVEVTDELPDIWADRDRLLQIFGNLIGNAVKFSEPGGRITVAAAEQNGDVLFSVADTGPGIAEEDLPKVFDRFWQARQNERHGAGLGLPIAKGLVEAHGGHIWVESTLGRGTTIFFTIPTVSHADERRDAQAPHHH